MKKTVQFLFFTLFKLGLFVAVFAQEKPTPDLDIKLKIAKY